MDVWCVVRGSVFGEHDLTVERSGLPLFWVRLAGGKRLAWLRFGPLLLFLPLLVFFKSFFGPGHDPGGMLSASNDAKRHPKDRFAFLDWYETLDRSRAPSLGEDLYEANDWTRHLLGILQSRSRYCRFSRSFIFCWR